jgi:hypothetical protein
MLVIGREAAAGRDLQVSDSLRRGGADGFARFDPDLKQELSFFAERPGSRRFPDVRWMEISSVLQQELAAGRSPGQIKQIEFVGETLDLASVLQWRRRIVEGEASVG